MLHTIEGPFLNKIDPWTRRVAEEDFFSHCNTTVSTIYLAEFILSFVHGGESSAANIKNEPLSANGEYVLIIQQKGKCEISDLERTVVLHSSEMILLSDKQAWDVRFSGDYSQIVLRFHSSYITPLIAEKEIILMTCFSSCIGVGSLLFNYLSELKNELELGHIVQSGAVPLSRSIINLIVACMLELNILNKKESSATYEYHIYRIKNYIAQNLREPTLSIETISTALGISAPHLHRIFKNEPLSISHYFWAKRLQGCVNDLSDETKSNESISTIAFSWGFNDAAHFSRVFKEKYGVSPSKWRKNKSKSMV
jgi:AraC-like DNA-binding protein